MIKTFTKKQYGIVLAVAAVVFAASFIIMYCIGFNIASKEEIPTKEELTTTTTPQELEEALAQVEEPLLDVVVAEMILPTTKIAVELVDVTGSIVQTDTLDQMALLGLTKEALATRFLDYSIKQFDEKEVVLVRQIEAPTLPTAYYLGVEEGVIGIAITGNQPEFLSLGVQAKDFPQEIISLLDERTVRITEAQRKQLEKDAYYIETIFQIYFD